MVDNFTWQPANKPRPDCLKTDGGRFDDSAGKSLPVTKLNILSLSGRKRDGQIVSF